MKSDGTPWRPLVHVSDICRAIADVLESPETRYTVLYSTSATADRLSSIRAIAEIVARSSRTVRSLSAPGAPTIEATASRSKGFTGSCLASACDWSASAVQRAAGPLRDDCLDRKYFFRAISRGSSRSSISQRPTRSTSRSTGPLGSTTSRRRQIVPEGPLVDVGIPTHGRPQFLAEALESVVRQTHTAWTLTISENCSRGPTTSPGSSSRTRRIPASATWQRAKTSARQEMTRASSKRGRRRTLRSSTTTIGGRPEFLERRVVCLEEHRQCALAFSTCDFIDENGRELFRYELGIGAGVQDQREFLRALYDRCLICMPTVLVARWAYEAVGPRFYYSVSSTTMRCGCAWPRDFRLRYCRRVTRSTACTARR